eukprot:7378888-Prymnesium_polylepis.1
MAAIFQLRPSCAKTTSPGKLGSSIFVVELFRSSLYIGHRPMRCRPDARARPTERLPQGGPWRGGGSRNCSHQRGLNNKPETKDGGRA